MPKPVEVTYRSDVTVELVKHAAEDTDVTFAARVSTLGGETRFNEATANDKGLINYLMRDRHGSPFEHNSMTFFVQAPIFVFREFMRHRVGFSYNEESGRYRELQPVFYVPDGDRKLVQEGKPGAYTFVEGTEVQRTDVRELLMENSNECYWMYRTLLDNGIAREVARMALPLNIYSSMYVTCNARSLMNFLTLRTTSTLAKVPSFPQREIEMVAEKMEAAWATLMPATYEAFNANGRVAP
jgi:thymidylate synthase (FAD)